MTTNIQLFNFGDGKEIRYVVSESGEPMFVAKDVFESLTVSWKGEQSLKSIPINWKGLTTLVTPSGKQDFITINEQAIYKIAFRSNKAEAETFTNKVAEIVMEIRKTGKYEAAPTDPDEVLVYQTRHLAQVAEQMYKVKMEMKEVRQEVKEIKALVVTSEVMSYAIVGWASLKGVRLSDAQGRALGREASKLSKNKGYMIDKVRDGHWGQVNRYHPDILELVFNDFSKSVNSK